MCVCVCLFSSLFDRIGKKINLRPFLKALLEKTNVYIIVSPCDNSLHYNTDSDPPESEEHM